MRKTTEAPNPRSKESLMLINLQPGDEYISLLPAASNHSLAKYYGRKIRTGQMLLVKGGKLPVAMGVTVVTIMK